MAVTSYPGRMPHPCGPQSSFLWIPLPKWGWILDTPPIQTLDWGLGGSVGWDGILHAQAVCWKTPVDAEH